MGVLRTHDYVLREGCITLRPLTDADLPLLYRWNADPEVLYWTEGEENPKPMTPEEVDGMYRQISQHALCFAIEVEGEFVGDCWLQKMNLPEVRALYPPDADVRRIDVTIGEKRWWGRGVGTRMLSLMLDFTFDKQDVDVLHCICEDYNVRSCKLWKRQGFVLVDPRQHGARHELHWRLTREEYRRRSP